MHAGFWLSILAVWLLSNILFVVMMTPPRKKVLDDRGARSARTDRLADLEEDGNPSVWLILFGLAVSTFLVLVPVVLRLFDFFIGVEKPPPR